jgi:hypothetical protein
MSKSLIKLVDNALLPAAVMILGKFLGVVLTIRFFNIPSSIERNVNSIASFSTTLRAEDVQLVTSYSDLIMFSSVALLFIFVIFKAVYFHSSHIKPVLVTRLLNKNLFHLIQNSYEIYHSAVVWLLFSWLASVLTLINVIAGQTYAWIGIAAVFCNIVLTAVLLQDVFREIENIKHNPGRYQWQ